MLFSRILLIFFLSYSLICTRNFRRLNDKIIKKRITRECVFFPGVLIIFFFFFFFLWEIECRRKGLFRNIFVKKSHLWNARFFFVPSIFNFSKKKNPTFLDKIQCWTTFIWKFFACDAYFWQHWALNGMYFAVSIKVIFQSHINLSSPLAPLRGEIDICSPTLSPKWNVFCRFYWVTKKCFRSKNA